MKVLVADDEQISRLTLSTFLKRWDYDVTVVEDGHAAWEAIQSCPPDLAIIDWEMPHLNGIELCEKIRSRKDLPYIYTIILTAKTEDKDMVIGLEAGADDYIVKPYSRDILHSRVAVGLRTVSYERRLAEQNQQLSKYSQQMEQLVEQRSSQLVHAERIATVGVLSAGIAHEINNPMTFISGNIQTLDRIWKDLSPCLKHPHEEITEDIQRRLDFARENFPEILDEMKNGIKRVSKIITGLKAFCRKEQGDITPCSINQSIERALELCHNTLKYHVNINCDLQQDLPDVLADSQQIEQVLVNLLINAADAIRDAHMEQGYITITTKVDTNNDNVTIRIQDSGPGIPTQRINDIWQPFFTTKPVDKGTGLGLSVSLGIIESHKGTITATNNPQGGACFTITLPLTPIGATS